MTTYSISLQLSNDNLLNEVIRGMQQLTRLRLSNISLLQVLPQFPTPIVQILLVNMDRPITSPTSFITPWKKHQLIALFGQVMLSKEQPPTYSFIWASDAF